MCAQIGNCAQKSVTLKYGILNQEALPPDTVHIARLVKVDCMWFSHLIRGGFRKREKSEISRTAGLQGFRLKALVQRVKNFFCL